MQLAEVEKVRRELARHAREHLQDWLAAQLEDLDCGDIDGLRSGGLLPGDGEDDPAPAAGVPGIVPGHPVLPAFGDPAR